MKYQNPPIPETHPVAPAALREADAAHYVGRSRAYLKKARLYARGPSFVRVQRTISYRLSDLDAWLASHVVRTNGERA